MTTSTPTPCLTTPPAPALVLVPAGALAPGDRIYAPDAPRTVTHVYQVRAGAVVVRLTNVARTESQVVELGCTDTVPVVR